MDDSNGPDMDCDMESDSDSESEAGDEQEPEQKTPFLGHPDARFPSRPIEISTLKEISAVAIALALWKHDNIPSVLSIRCPKASESPEWAIFAKKVADSRLELPIPYLMRNVVEWYIGKIGKEIVNWVAYHHRVVFFENGNDYPLYYHFYDMVWYPNGTINCKETARQLMSSYRLSDIEKYRFLCTYCLRNEMAQVSPAMFLNRFKDYVSFEQYPLICYWNGYFKNQLFHFPTPFRQNLAQNILMARHSKVDNWQAKEFFFDNLNADDQIQCAKLLITEYGLEYQKLILMKLDEVQRLQLYDDYAVNVMTNYAGIPFNLDEVLPTWLEIRNLINENQFLIIFRRLLDTETNDTTLTIIWNEASRDFKQHFLNYENHQMIEKVFSQWKRKERGELLFAVLSDTPPAIGREITTREYFGEVCELLLVRKRIPMLDQMLHFCLPGAREFVNFKRNLAINSEAVKKYCTKRYKKRGNVNRINAYLTSLMPNQPEAIAEYKKNLLMSDHGMDIGSSYLSTAEKREILKKIIDDGLPTKDLVTAFSKNLIFSNSAIGVLRSNMKIGSIDVVKECVDTHLVSEEDKKTLKRRLINDVTLLRKLFIMSSKSQCEAVIRWCLGNDEAIEKFKIALPVDLVFDEILKYCVFRKYDEAQRVSMCTYFRDPDFGPLDVFLNWYFKSAGKINQYKLQRVNSWLDIEMITTLLKKKNESHIRAVMSWFFQKDNKKHIAKFKKKFAGEKIVSMV